MIGDRSVTVPQEYIAVKMEDRKKRGRRPGYNPEEAEDDVDDPPGTVRWEAEVVVDSEDEETTETQQSSHLEKTAGPKRQRTQVGGVRGRP